MVSSGSVMNSGNVVCRNHPGTKNEDFYNWPPQKFDEMDSTLAVQQYIQQLIRQNYKDVDAILSAPVGQDIGVWKYEQLRQFCLELNGLAVRLQSECTPETCSQMTATEQWIFLCAAHKTPKECPAIDYTRHTLDGAASLLNSNKHFSSRVNIKESSVAKLGSTCRRVYRIFSHAYYHHRQIFDEAENETYLCRRFTSFVIKYNLMSQDNLIVPILVEFPDDNLLDPNSNQQSKTTGMSIAKKPSNILSGITSFLDLPEGVVPDLESDLKFDENFPDVLDEDSALDVDDEFSFSSDAHYATLKPAREGSLSVKDVEKESFKQEKEAAETADFSEDDAGLDATLQTTVIQDEKPSDPPSEDILDAESPKS